MLFICWKTPLIFTEDAITTPEVLRRQSFHSSLQQNCVSMPALEPTTVGGRRVTHPLFFMSHLHTSRMIENTMNLSFRWLYTNENTIMNLT